MSPPDETPEPLRWSREAASSSEAIQLIQHGEDLNEAGAYLEALETLQRAIEVDPNSARAFVARAWALENLGPEHFAEAQAAYEKGLALDPTNPWAGEGLAHRLELEGDTAEAEALYRAVVAGNADSSDPDVLEIVGWCWHRLRQDDEAEPSYRRALEIDGDRAATRFDLALSLFELDRDAEGRAEIEAALRTLEAASPDARRATVQVALDDLDEAQALRPELASKPEVGRARVQMESALGGSPAP